MAASASCVAPRPGVLVTAPKCTPRSCGSASAPSEAAHIPTVRSRLTPTDRHISPLSPQPLFLRVEKNDGPTCRPMKKTKRTRPKLRKNEMIEGSTSTPR